MLLRLPRCATYSRISPACLCDDHPMGSVTGAKPAKVAVAGLVRRSRRHFDPRQRALGVRPRSPQDPAHHPAAAAVLVAFGTSLRSNASSPPGFDLDPARLPYRQQVLDLLQQEKASGRRIALTTAADRELAEAISSYLGLFDEVHASDGQRESQGSEQSCVSSRALRRDRLRLCRRLCRRPRSLAQRSRGLRGRHRSARRSRPPP